MITLATYKSGVEARRECHRFIEAQKLVDRVWERIHGQPVVPVAEESYKIVVVGGEFALVCIDPSIPEDKR